MFKIVRASGEAFLGTLKYVPMQCSYSHFCRTSGEAVLSTCFNAGLLIWFCLRLRRGDFRYTKIVINANLLIWFVRASGEASLGTLKYVTMQIS